MTNSKEKKMIELMHFLADKFKERIVLEGGMLLRLMNSPRSTQDIDYLFISDRSKKELAAEIKKALAAFGDVHITETKLNSRGIFVELETDNRDEGKIMIEVNVVPSLNLASDQFSTVSLSSQYSMGGRVISTIALPEAFSHKIAACIERENMRDLYDLSVFEPLCGFDLNTLKKRLERASINRKKPKQITIKEASEILKQRSAELSEKKLENELYPLIPVEQHPGLLAVIRSAIARIVQRLLAA